MALFIAAPALAQSTWSVPPDRLPATVTALRQAVEDVCFRHAPLGPLRAQVRARTLRCGAEQYDLDWLREAAERGDTALLVNALARLKGWEATLQPPVPAPAGTAATVAEILRGEAYQPVKASSWIEAWLPAIERCIDFLLAPFLGRAEHRGARRVVAAVAVCVAGAGLLTWLFLRTGRRVGRRAAAAAAMAGVARPAARRAAEWRRMAAEAGADGRSEEALGLLYLALLARLDESGRLALDRSRTNQENARATGGALAAGLRELGRTLDSVSYGGRPCAHDELARCERLVDSLWSPP